MSMSTKILLGGREGLVREGGLGREGTVKPIGGAG